MSSAKRSAAAAELSGGPAGKRSSSSAQQQNQTVVTLQRELQQERDRHERLQESVEQLRLELQMMGRLLAAAREQLVACGATAVEPSLMVRVPPAPTSGGANPARSKSDARRMQQMQDQLAESRALCHRLAQQVESQQQKMQAATGSKKELLGLAAEMSEYLSSNRL
jgi:chromosome segregation ATPase